MDGQVIHGAETLLPLSAMNRHGLVSGTTGGGKTMSFPFVADGLSGVEAPAPKNTKGNLSGMATPVISNFRIDEHYQNPQMKYSSKGFRVELLP